MKNYDDWLKRVKITHERMGELLKERRKHL